MMKKVLLTIAIASLLAPGFGGIALADQGELDLSHMVTTFSSPGDLYGPWNITWLQYKTRSGNDTPSITLLNRNDDDRPTGTHSTAVYVDDYHDWNKNVYTYVQVVGSSGDVLPTRGVYGEADLKFGQQQDTVVAVGGATLKNPDGTTTNYASIGPTFYQGPLSAGVRFLPSWTNGSTAAGTQFLIEHNVPDNHDLTLSYLFGTQPNVLAGLPVTGFQRISQVDAGYKKWVTTDVGYNLGLGFGTHTDRNTGAKLYNGTSFTFGLVFGHLP